MFLCWLSNADAPRIKKMLTHMSTADVLSYHRSGLSSLLAMPGRIDFILDVTGQYAISAAIKAMFECE